MYEYFLMIFFFKIKKEAFSNITAAKLETACGHKLNRTEEILQVKQN